MDGISLSTCSKNCTATQRMLADFLKHGIEEIKLTPLDHLIELSEINQIRILNSYLSMREQRVLFGATRNISTVTKVMKEKLKIAKKIHENPTTIEQSLELIEPLENVCRHVDYFMSNKRVLDLKRLNELSRIFYKKACSLGFYKDVDSQLKDAGITEEEVKDFITKLNENVELEMEILDEAS